MGNDFQIIVKGNTLVIEGFFTIMTGESRAILTNRLEELANEQEIVIDLSKCQYINSSVVACLSRYIVKNKQQKIELLESDLSLSVNASVRNLKKIARV